MSGRSTRSSYERNVDRLMRGERLVMVTPPRNGLLQVRQAKRTFATLACRRDQRDPGADKARARLERKHTLALRKAFAKLGAIIVPARSTVRTLTVEGAIRRLYDRQGILRDVLMAMMTEAVLLGAAHGWDDIERLMGIHTNANRTNLVLGVGLMGAGTSDRKSVV